MAAATHARRATISCFNLQRVNVSERSVRDARRSSRGVKLLISEVPGGGRAAVGRSEVNKE